MHPIRDAFGIVLFIVVGVGVGVAMVTFAMSGKVYDEIGKGGLFNEDDAHGRPPTPATSAAVRDDEIRQMLEARNARRVRQGKEPIDVEAEIAKLTRPAVDAALLAEIRDLVEARNARRVRQGKEPLDVEAEVARQLDALT